MGEYWGVLDGQKSSAEEDWLPKDVDLHLAHCKSTSLVSQPENTGKHSTQSPGSITVGKRPLLS